MTSKTFNERKAQAQAEMAIFDALPSGIRSALDSACGSVRASSARDALLRGVPESLIIETILKKPKGDQS